MEKRDLIELCRSSQDENKTRDENPRHHRIVCAIRNNPALAGINNSECAFAEVSLSHDYVFSRVSSGVFECGDVSIGICSDYKNLRVIGRTYLSPDVIVFGKDDKVSLIEVKTEENRNVPNWEKYGNRFIRGVEMFMRAVGLNRIDACLYFSLADGSVNTYRTNAFIDSGKFGFNRDWKIRRRGLERVE